MWPCFDFQARWASVGFAKTSFVYRCHVLTSQERRRAFFGGLVISPLSSFRLRYIFPLLWTSHWQYCFRGQGSYGWERGTEISPSWGAISSMDSVPDGGCHHPLLLGWNCSCGHFLVWLVTEQQGQVSEEPVVPACSHVTGALRWGALMHHGRARPLGRMRLLCGEQCSHARSGALTLGIPLLPHCLSRPQGIADVGSSLKMMVKECALMVKND